MVGLALVLSFSAHAQSNSISGWVWHDLNTNGLQDIGEPALNNYVFIALTNSWSDRIIAECNEYGHYTFSNLNPGIYSLLVGSTSTYSHQLLLTLVDQGDDDLVDSDFEEAGLINNLDISNGTHLVFDAGFRDWKRELTLTNWIVGFETDESIIVVEGESLERVCRVENTGETILTPVDLSDSEFGSIVTLFFPHYIAPGEVYWLTNHFLANHSMTGSILAVGLPTDFMFYSLRYDPVVVSSDYRIIVVDADAGIARVVPEANAMTWTMTNLTAGMSGALEQATGSLTSMWEEVATFPVTGWTMQCSVPFSNDANRAYHRIRQSW